MSQCHAYEFYFYDTNFIHHFDFEDVIKSIIIFYEVLLQLVLQVSMYHASSPRF
jgi:hypothetical protein